MCWFCFCLLLLCRSSYFKVYFCSHALVPALGHVLVHSLEVGCQEFFIHENNKDLWDVFNAVSFRAFIVMWQSAWTQGLVRLFSVRWFVFSGENGFCVLPQQNRLLVARFFVRCTWKLSNSAWRVCVWGCSFNMDGWFFYGKQQLTLAFQGLSFHFQFVVIVSHPTGT